MVPYEDRPLTRAEYQDLLAGLRDGSVTRAVLERLPRVGVGMSRTAYLLRVEGYEPTVLKVQAQDPANLQMVPELVCSLEGAGRSPLIPEVYEWGPPGPDPTWAEVEHAPSVSPQEFERLAKVPWLDMQHAVEDMSQRFDAAGLRLDFDDAQDFIEALGPAARSFGEQVVELIELCDLDPYDLGYLPHWGIGYDETLKMTDLGLLAHDPSEETKQRLLAW